MSLRGLGHNEQFQKKLTETAHYFRTIHFENKNLFASILNGIGSVFALRGQFKEALIWIDRALEIEPDYEAAKHDRQTVIQYLSKIRA
jgi:tetratricopeptide (TPR) repeat protein